MRYFGIALALLFSLASTAQKKSRIVFFRMDVPIGPESSAFKEVRNFTDNLQRNGETIGRLRSHSVFIYETDSTTANYYLANKDRATPSTSKISIGRMEGKIYFSRIALIDDAAKPYYSEMLDSAEFADYYYGNKWIRKQLANQGFNSLPELLEGYELLPLKPKQSLQYRYATKIKRTFSDTLFFNTMDILTDKPNADYYSVATKDETGQIEVIDCFSKNGKIKSKTHYATLDSESKEGPCEQYYISGNIESRGQYKDNLKDGKWVSYYDTVNSPIWYECSHKNGSYNDTLKTYYPNGKLKRKELHRTFASTYKYGPTKNSYTLEKDSIVSGSCFDEYGKPVKFTPFYVPAHLPIDLNVYLAKNLHYPDSSLKHDIEGRVIVKFGIDKYGIMHEPTIMKGVSDDINREAIRVVSDLPPWTPGMRDDKPASVVFTLPITFKLE